MANRRILIVANQTAAGSHLKRIVAERVKEGPCTFTLVVPATPPAGTLTWTDAEATELATRRMDQALAGLRELGADVEGIVSDGSPTDAVDSVMQVERYQHHQSFDEIILSTLPPGISRWLKQDLPHRVERRYEIPVTHVIAEAPASIS